MTFRDATRPFGGTVQVITGAAPGIGRTIALELARAGAIVAADLDGATLATLVNEAVAAGTPEPAIVVGDQSTEEVVIATIRAAIDRFGGLDGVVFSAGIGVVGPLEELDLAM